MCFYIISYVEWGCGFRQNTNRQHLDCRRTICRLSEMHKTGEHDCNNICEGTATREQHLVTNTYPDVCQQCEEAGRDQHPGVQRTEDGGAAGGIPFRYLVG